ncbi:Hint domain-containing protein [Paenibacillus cellulosilyticus]|uniref:Hint domain-containing protein n=1 Tax=Paenibacillus cellulosilyticus TaxID=375489 RepID=A0A2V2YTU4_9BACL|nr:Hint domain-containing protein [Paenibacillus cellulosilyticus]PWW01256.1 Hint domain-containing protein [Paenibacillus cellulosilyticus]QKS46795.1 Hint domain-containing protein [Paenibacillus cellulosilyticus]
MAWEDCVANIKRNYAGKRVEEISTVNWSGVSQDAIYNDTFRNGDPFFLICPDRHCVDFVNTTPADHALCQCKDINGNPIPDCTPPSALYPEKASVCLNIQNPKQYNAKSGKSCYNQPNGDWNQLTCYCCCSCFANGTRIGIPNGHKAIEQFLPGDKVLTANMTVQGTGVDLSWSAATVKFSNGTGPDGHQSAMIWIRHGEEGMIIVTPDHLFLMPNGKLKRADRLVPGNDRLVSADGMPIMIHEVSIGEYHGGVHHISTDKAFDGSIDGHLLIAEGVVSGDFMLQVYAPRLKELHFVDDHDSLPKIGSPEYEANNAHLQGGVYRSFKTAEPVQNTVPQQPQKFYVHGQRVTAIPDNTAKFLSTQQERDLDNNADKQNFTDVGIGNAMIQYVLKLFRGFYSDIVFYHDIGRLETNGYAFEQYGKKIIVISGGLTRIKDLSQEGLAVILAHLITRLQKIAPLGNDGYTSVGMADYYATNVLRNVYFGQAYNQALGEGLEQIRNDIFAHIESAQDQYEEDPFAPTTDTRLDAFAAGDGMQYPPEGIGGPVQFALQVESALALPNTLNTYSFITEDISHETSIELFECLQTNKVLDDQGGVAADFTVDTDLMFVFSSLDMSNSFKRLLTEQVRYVLLHAGASVKIRVSLPLNAVTAMNAANYSFVPEACVLAVRVSTVDPSVTVTAGLKRGIEYVLTVSNLVRAEDGSTLDPEHSSVSFKWE